MTLALINPEPVSVKLRPLVSRTQLRKWLNELEHLQKETAFFRKLLKSGLPNCSDRMKPLMKNLLEEFAQYETEILPSLALALEEASNRALTENEVSLAVSKRLEKHLDHLKKLKSKVFPHLQELQPVTLW